MPVQIYNRDSDQAYVRTTTDPIEIAKMPLSETYVQVTDLVDQNGHHIDGGYLYGLRDDGVLITFKGVNEDVASLAGIKLWKADAIQTKNTY